MTDLDALLASALALDGTAAGALADYLAERLPGRHRAAYEPPYGVWSLTAGLDPLDATGLVAVSFRSAADGCETRSDAYYPLAEFVSHFVAGFFGAFGPRHEHDCGHCLFLGWMPSGGADDPGIDLYYCPASRSLVARRSSDPADYDSCSPGVSPVTSPAHLEAGLRASRRGYL